MNKLIRIINEEIQNIKKADINAHADQRLEQRLETMYNNGDITPREYQIIRSNFDKILENNFNEKKEDGSTMSYGIFLGSFRPNPKSPLYTVTNTHNPGIPFYEILSNTDSVFPKDSTGDEMWAIIRNNVVETIMLRKRLQRKFNADDRSTGTGGLGVDKEGIILDLDEYLRKRREKEETDKANAAPKEADPTLKPIKGVMWKIDKARNGIHKKNNPNFFVKYDDIYDYPDWDEKTKVEILDILDGNSK